MSRNVTSSVAMATYKGTRYVLEQLRSIEEQTVLPDEVVICDDVSADDTVAVIQEYSKTSKLNIRLYQNENITNKAPHLSGAFCICV
jgi:glycosyltransferase involved in cell wall biosynthesis